MQGLGFTEDFNISNFVKLTVYKRLKIFKQINLNKSIRNENKN